MTVIYLLAALTYVVCKINLHFVIRGNGSDQTDFLYYWNWKNDAIRKTRKSLALKKP